MMVTKRQDFPSGLWIVATPIGNLADLTDRARQALETADAILCEDTRRTSQLLSALGISAKPLERLDAHSSPAKLAKLVERLEAGESFALVSDAGTPAISDPGAALVHLAREAGVPVTPVPGASSVMALLSVCGFEETAFCFRGFFPRKLKDGSAEIALAARSPVARVFIWFESPQRIVETLGLFATECADARIVVAKELTKIHEKFFAGSAGEASALVASEISEIGERGEWCFAALFPVSSPHTAESSDWVKALHCLLNAQVSASEAARQVSQHFGIARNKAYAKALELRSTE